MVSRAVAMLHFLLLAFAASTTAQDRPPNILFAIADDWGWPHNSSRSPSAGKRPAEELYDLRNDPGQFDNVASDPAFADAKDELSEAREKALDASGDRRVVGKGARFDSFPYYGGTPLAPGYERR